MCRNRSRHPGLPSKPAAPPLSVSRPWSRRSLRALRSGVLAGATTAARRANVPTRFGGRVAAKRVEVPAARSGRNGARSLIANGLPLSSHRCAYRHLPLRFARASRRVRRNAQSSAHRSRGDAQDRAASGDGAGAVAARRLATRNPLRISPEATRQPAGRPPDAQRPVSSPAAPRRTRSRPGGRYSETLR